jgi:hypothetical protein
VDEHDHELYNISAACNELLNLRIIYCTMIRNLEHQIRLSPVFPAITEWKCGTQLLWNTELHCAIRGMAIDNIVRLKCKNVTAYFDAARDHPRISPLNGHVMWPGPTGPFFGTGLKS